MEGELKRARHAHTRGPQGSWGLCHSHSLTRSHGPVSRVPTIPAPLQRHKVDWGVSPQGGVCVLGCTHTRVCTLSGRRGSLLIPFQRVPPPPPRQAGRRACPAQGHTAWGAGLRTPALHPAPLHSLPSGDSGGGLPSRAPGLRVPPCFPPGWVAATPLTWPGCRCAGAQTRLTSPLCYLARLLAGPMAGNREA